MEKKDSLDDSELRQWAEKKLGLGGNTEFLSEMSPEKTAALIHELQVHQIELKMQNDELRRIHEELEASRDRYSHLYDFAPIGYLTLTEKGLIDEANLTLATMLGVTRSALPGKPFSHFILKADQDIFYKHRQQLLDMEDLQTCELRLVKNDAHTLYARLECRVIENRSHDQRQIRVAVSDITEIKAIEANLRQSQKMESIGILAGGIAHDFNNILGIIIGNTELALEDLPKWHPSYDNFEEIKIAGLRAKNIVRQLLGFSRRSNQTLLPIEITPVIQDSLRFLRSTIPATIEIQQNILTRNEMILADPTQISQIMINLFINASHAMEQTGGLLSVHVENVTLDDTSANEYPGLNSGRYVRIRVKDTGPGISPEIITRIFDPYFTTKTIGKGSGMGLAVVQGIVQNHHGAIQVESRPGRGAVFTILFPVVENSPTAEIEAKQDVLHGTETILFVDDEEPIVRITKRILERIGYRVETEINPAAALDLFKSKPSTFDLVITDMTMPQMTGVKFAERIMEIRPDIPVIIASGHSSLIDEQKARELGIAAYIMKPFQQTEISTAIRKVMDGIKNKI